MDSLLQAGRIPGFRLLSRRRLAPLAQPRERQDPGDLAVERSFHCDEQTMVADVLARAAAAQR